MWCKQRNSIDIIYIYIRCYTSQVLDAIVFELSSYSTFYLMSSIVIDVNSFWQHFSNSPTAIQRLNFNGGWGFIIGIYSAHSHDIIITPCQCLWMNKLLDSHALVWIKFHQDRSEFWQVNQSTAFLACVGLVIVIWQKESIREFIIIYHN